MELLRCETRLNRIPGEKAINYSDHIGVYAEFAVSDHNKVFFMLIIRLCYEWIMGRLCPSVSPSGLFVLDQTYLFGTRGAGV